MIKIPEVARWWFYAFIIVFAASVLFLLWQFQVQSSHSEMLLEQRTPIINDIQGRVKALQAEVTALRAAEEKHAKEVERLKAQKGTP